MYFLQIALQITLKKNLSTLSLNKRKTLRSGSAPAVARYAVWWRHPQRSLHQKVDLPEGQVQQCRPTILLNLGTCRFSISPHLLKIRAHRPPQIPKTKAATRRGQLRKMLLAGMWCNVPAGPDESRPRRQ